MNCAHLRIFPFIQSHCGDVKDLTSRTLLQTDQFLNEEMTTASSSWHKALTENRQQYEASINNELEQLDNLKGNVDKFLSYDLKEDIPTG